MKDNPSRTRYVLSRRQLLAAALLGAIPLAGCTTGDGTEPTTDGTETTRPTTTSAPGAATTEPTPTTDRMTTTADETTATRPGSTTTESSVTRVVEAVESTFSPVRLTVAPNTTVEWVNRDSFGHTITSEQFHGVAADWEFSASLSSEGDRTAHTFIEPGIYEYYCTIHSPSNMCGVVLVGDVTLDDTLPCE